MIEINFQRIDLEKVDSTFYLFTIALNKIILGCKSMHFFVKDYR